jgi:hypothetical protein
MSVLQKILAMLLLKSAPQDLPYSPQFPVQMALVYVFSGVLVLQTTINPDDLLGGLLLSLATQFLFTYIVLGALDKAARFVQTMSAILAVSIMFNLLSWPVFIIITDSTASESLKSTMSLLFLFIMSWEVLVKAHIFRHALEMRMFSALALSFSLLFISIALSQMFFPAESAG